MHLLLTDRLTCPRCGPTFGLILLASRIDDRVVSEGRLGCPNCRDSFPIEAGFVDLREPPRGPLPTGLAGGPEMRTSDEKEAERLVALLGIMSGPGTVALVGEPARHAARLTHAVEEIHVAAVDADLRLWPEAPRISRVVAAPGLPFFSSTLRGLGVDGRLGFVRLAEAARAAAPGGRVVVTHAPEGTEDALRGSGLTVLAAEDETVVAARS